MTGSDDTPQGEDAPEHDPEGQTTDEPLRQRIERALPATDLEGRLLADRYRLKSPLGRGGQATLWRAQDERLDVEVAVKLIDSFQVGAERSQSFFTAEKRALAVALQACRSQQVARIRDVGAEEAALFLVMDLIRGTNLHEFVAAVPTIEGVATRAPLTSMTDRVAATPQPFGGARNYERAIAWILSRVCDVLQEVHEAGVVHRDLKPSNVMIDERGQPIIVDFGLAATIREVGDEEGLSGTAPFLAPEQLRSRRTGADVRTDLYQLGHIGYSLLAGRSAYDAKRGELLATDILESRMPALTDVALYVPEELARLLERAYAPEIERRYPSARAFGQALEGWLRATDLPRWDHERFVEPRTLWSDDQLERLIARDVRQRTDVFIEVAGPGLRKRARDEFDVIERRVAAVSQVEHPRVLSYRDAMLDDEGTLRLVLRARRGTWLQEVLETQETLSPKEVRRLGEDLASGLHALHREGHVHRGLGPAHVLIEEDGHAALAGFCFVKPIGGPGTTLGSVAGGHQHVIPSYAAPEQFAGHSADHRVDVFGLGCLLFRAATGIEARHSADHRDYREPDEKKLRRALGRKPAEVILRAVSTVPRARHPNMGEFVREWAGAFDQKRGLPWFRSS